MPPIHLQPTAPLAQRVLLPGDPARALRLAQALLVKPQMFNHHRGLWGYTGRTEEGLEVTVQSTGMGGPSAAIVASELIELGARTLVRVGTCGALAAGLALGELIVAGEAHAADGASRALGAGERIAADGVLTGALARAGGGRPPCAVVSTDLFYDPREPEAGWREAGAVAVEMECAALYAVSLRGGAAAGAVLAVSDLLHPERRRIEADALTEAELAMGRLALRALADGGSAA